MCTFSNNENNLDFNDKFTLAHGLLENSRKNVFVTGRAGTGKSTLLRYFRENTRKNIVVLAPTGVAAVNIKGQTIHSFFRFKPDITPDGVPSLKIRKSDRNIYKKLDAVVIDEISMVRADLLDCVDTFLRLHGKSKALAFGGAQMIVIGDLYQLPPIVKSNDKNAFSQIYKSPYFFDAKSLESFDMEFVELEKIYRQKDEAFIKILNAIRNKSVTEDNLKVLNERYIPDFRSNPGDFYIYLTTTNAMAEAVNLDKLRDLKTKERRYSGTITGNFEMRNLPTQESLNLKIGAQVMLLNNDSNGRWINGSIGKILSFKTDNSGREVIDVEITDGSIVEVNLFTWEMFRFFYNEDTERIDSESVGIFTQYPLKLAWAVTIHKSQGKTFSKVILDIGRGAFAHGQTYVALSRCTSLRGIVLKKPVQKKHIILDWRVVNFLIRSKCRVSEELCSLDRKRNILESAICGKKELDITYLNAKDEQSHRIIRPKHVGEMEYLGKSYWGVEAYCLKRGQSRSFRLDRILSIRDVCNK